MIEPGAVAGLLVSITVKFENVSTCVLAVESLPTKVTGAADTGEDSAIDAKLESTIAVEERIDNVFFIIFVIFLIISKGSTTF